MKNEDTRFIAHSYPEALTPAKRAQAVSILSEWLETPERQLAMRMKTHPFRVGHLRRLAELLDVNITGASLVLDSERSGVSRRMLGSGLSDDAPIATWGKKLIRLGLFCGYYAARPDSRTTSMAYTIYKSLENDNDLVWCFRSSARMMYLGEAQMVAYQEARRQLACLWHDGSTQVYLPEELPTETDGVIKRRPDYPVARRFDGRLTWASLRDGIGPYYVCDRTFDRFQRDDDGWLVIDGNNTGIAFVNCTLRKVRFMGKLNGAQFIGCTFDEVDFMASLHHAAMTACRGKVAFVAVGKDAMNGMVFTHTRLDVSDADYTLAGATLVSSALVSLEYSLGAKHPIPGNTAPFGVAAPTSFGYTCMESMAKRAERFEGVQLINSFIDVPFEFFGEALREAMTPEDFEAWEQEAEKFRGEKAIQAGEYGDIQAFGLMGDALAPLYFPDMLQG